VLSEADVTGGLTRRAIIASALLAIVIAAAFAVLLRSIYRERDAAKLARHSQVVLATANGLERLVLDLETGQRGFLITRDENFLQPWREARTTIPGVSRELIRLAQVREQDRRARGISADIESYIRDYSIPQVRAARRDEASARSVAATDEGKRLVDAIRREFDGLIDAERGLSGAREDRSSRDARVAIIATVVGLGGSVLLIAVFAGYLTRAIVLPVRRAAAMAGRLAGGELSTRMPETGVAEIGDLEHSFNTMAGSLEASRDELRLLAEEQAALRRVATLVARGASPSEVFDAVAVEAGGLLGADFARLLRYEADGTATVVAIYGERDMGVPVGGRLTLEGVSVAGEVLRTGRAARLDRLEGVPGPIAAQLRELGVSSAVGAPVVVEGRLWGALVGAWTREALVPAETEARMGQFTELLATAIANAESRAELAASRARVVAAADHTRRRIERDLHDGAQQRLVSLGLELRAAEAMVPAELEELKARLSQTAKGLGSVLEELQELSRGIHPAILSKGGLGAALKTLARRSAVPVELTLNADKRLPERVEVAAYFVVSEALTNAAKYAQASVVHVDLEAADSIVKLSIRDDGIGGADPSRGSGLIGLRDRIESLGGRIEVASPGGGGTALRAEIPIGEK
jgi:signal transduction histidine kinase